MSLRKALDPLQYSRELFEELDNGKHINAVQHPALWNALSGDNLESYTILFEHLGKKLVRNPRGYAHFELEESNPKGTRDFVLFFLLTFQRMADAGHDLHGFESWRLDPVFFEELRGKNAALLRTVRLDSEDNWRNFLNKAVRLGFLEKEGSICRLLPATWRFLDLFLELDQAAQESPEEPTSEDDSLGDAEEEFEENEEEDA